MKHLIVSFALFSNSLAVIHDIRAGPGYLFTPQKLVISKGDSVTWIFAPNEYHSVVATSGPTGCIARQGTKANSGTRTSGNYSVAFTSNTGNFYYISDIQGQCAAGMRGEITIQEGPGAGANGTATPQPSALPPDVQAVDGSNSTTTATNGTKLATVPTDSTVPTTLPDPTSTLEAAATALNLTLFLQLLPLAPTVGPLLASPAKNTLFIPSNAAITSFASYSAANNLNTTTPEFIEAFLSQHIIPGSVLMAESFTNGQMLSPIFKSGIVVAIEEIVPKPIENSNSTATNGTAANSTIVTQPIQSVKVISVQAAANLVPANIVLADAVFSGGVIHVIDSVLMVVPVHTATSSAIAVCKGTAITFAVIFFQSFL